eukprot:gene11850-15856_t
MTSDSEQSELSNTWDTHHREANSSFNGVNQSNNPTMRGIHSKLRLGMVSKASMTRTKSKLNNATASGTSVPVERYNLHFINNDPPKSDYKPHNFNQNSSKTNLISEMKPLYNHVPPVLNKVIEKKHSSKINKEVLSLNQLQIANVHPKISPRNGTDISIQHQVSILRCEDQSKCIVPELQLQKKFKVYFCRHPTKQGVRFYYLVNEGLQLHPNVEIVPFERISEADFIIYLPGSAPWHLTECTDPTYANRLIVLDEFDGSTLFSPVPDGKIEQVYGKNNLWYFMYFKRSYVSRRDGRFLGHIHMNKPDVYPITYAIAEAYTMKTFNHQREIDILCTLRGSKHMTTRLRVQEWVAEYGKDRNIANYISGQVNSETRTTLSKGYFQQMFNSKIIVTVNPANWEGDFRLWESMCTGALIMVDELDVPYGFPLQHGKHIIYFSNENKTDLFDKLDYYLKNPEEARRIAINGYLYAMKYHRTVNLIDYVLRSSHYKQAILQNVNPIPSYVYTSQQVLQYTRAKDDYYKDKIRRSRLSLSKLDASATASQISKNHNIHFVESTTSATSLPEQQKTTSIKTMISSAVNPFKQTNYQEKSEIMELKKKKRMKKGAMVSMISNSSPNIRQNIKFGN